MASQLTSWMGRTWGWVFRGARMLRIWWMSSAVGPVSGASCAAWARGEEGRSSQRRQADAVALGMQVRIRTNSLEFQFAPNSHEFVDRPELEFATSNPKASLIRLIESIGTYNLPSRLQFTCLHMGMPLPSTVSHKRFPKSFRNLAFTMLKRFGDLTKKKKIKTKNSKVP